MQLGVCCWVIVTAIGCVPPLLGVLPLCSLLPLTAFLAPASYPCHPTGSYPVMPLLPITIIPLTVIGSIYSQASRVIIVWGSWNRRKDGLTQCAAVRSTWPQSWSPVINLLTACFRVLPSASSSASTCLVLLCLIPLCLILLCLILLHLVLLCALTLPAAPHTAVPLTLPAAPHTAMLSLILVLMQARAWDSLWTFGVSAL